MSKQLGGGGGVTDVIESFNLRCICINNKIALKSGQFETELGCDERNIAIPGIILAYLNESFISGQFDERI